MVDAASIEDARGWGPTSRAMRDADSGILSGFVWGASMALSVSDEEWNGME